MARTPALFNGPIEFTDANGSQISLPLSDLYFDDSGQIHAHGAAYTANKAVVDAWLKYLIGAGLLVADQQPPVAPALVITAANPGAFGNFIQITFADPDPTNSTFDVTVSETDTYTGLTPGTLQNVLGNTAGGGTQPGLVFVPVPVPASPPTMPKVTDPNKDIQLTVTPPNTSATAPVPSASGTAFTVQAKSSQADGALTTVAIQNVTATTFTLVAKWSKQVKATKVGVADLKTNFGYEIGVAAPSGVTAAPPAPGTYVLSGGADAVSLAAAPASATLTTG